MIISKEVKGNDLGKAGVGLGGCTNVNNTIKDNRIEISTEKNVVSVTHKTIIHMYELS